MLYLTLHPPPARSMREVREKLEPGKTVFTTHTHGQFAPKSAPSPSSSPLQLALRKPLQGHPLYEVEREPSGAVAWRLKWGRSSSPLLAHRNSQHQSVGQCWLDRVA